MRTIDYPLAQVYLGVDGGGDSRGFGYPPGKIRLYVAAGLKHYEAKRGGSDAKI